jgi:hypothetical protein
MSEVKVNKLSPRSGTTVTIGDSGDTINIVGTLQNNGAAIPGDISSVVAGTGLSGGGTSGDVTINIEAAQPTITSTGTLTGFTSTGIDDNADATAITINSSESVGIGETSPLAKLHVKIGDSGASANAGGNEMVVEDSAGAGISILSGNTSKGQIIFGDDGDDNAGRLVYDHSDNNLASWTNGSERMRIDSSGNVAIATTSAVAPLTVASGSDTGAISLGGDVSSSGITNNTRKIGRLVVPSYATAEEPVGVILADFNGSDNQIAIGGGSSSVNSATKILFLTGANSTTASGTERMNLGSSGALKIAKDGAAFNSNTAHQFIDSGANTYSLMVSNKASSPASQYMIEVGFKSAAPDNNSARFMQFIDNSATRAEIMSDGDFRSHDNSYGSTSDERIKQDIVDSGSQWDDIKAVKVRKFKKKDDVRQYGDEAWVQIGVIAQELEAAGMDKLIKHSDPNSSDILSDSTFGTLYKDGDEIPEGKVIGDIKEIKTQIKSVGYSVLYMKAIKALQEAMTRIETLEAEVTALKNQP